MSDTPINNHKALLQKAFLSIEQLQNRLNSIESAKKEPIAVIGMSCRFPGGGNDPQGFWHLLYNAVDAIEEMPNDRWDVEALYNSDPDEPGKMYTRWGGFLKNINLFDASFFGLSPREAICLDPQQRLTLEVVWEALENSGYPVSSLAGSQTGVFIGASTTDYGIKLLSSPESIDIYTGTGISNNVLAGRISYLLDLQGPCLAVDTACSSSLVALHLACQSLRSKESNLAIVGGVNIMLLSSFFLIFSKTRMMSPDGRCKTFDARANGYVRGEGCGIVILKRLSDALADKDNILAVIRGTAINQDGHSSGLTVPNILAQQKVIKQALDNAEIKPNQVSYVEAHGTGTPLGDPIEIEALNAVYGKPDETTNPCYVASVKTNIGHLEAAAGVAALIKTILCLQNKTIVANLHLKQLNPNISLTSTRLAIPTTATDWDASHRLAGISSFGWSGTNAHVIVEQADQYLAKNSARQNGNTQIERPYQILTISAKSSVALQSLTEKYQIFVSETKPDLTQLSVSSHITRNHFNHRLALVAANKEQLLEQLRDVVEGELLPPVPNGRSKRVAFLFTGQGSQYINMAKQLYQSQAFFRQIIDQCNDIAQPYLTHSLIDVIYPQNENTKDLINQTLYTQPVLFAIEYALAKLWQQWGIEPDAVIGHSIGEYSAACFAGVLSLADGLRLVAERGRLMQSLPQNGLMVAIFAPLAKVQELIADYSTQISIAGINSLENIVISGHQVAITSILATCQTQEISYQQLKVSHPFHSVLLEPIIEQFHKVAKTINYQVPEITLISNLTGKAMVDAPGADYWCQHLLKPVQFVDGIRTLALQKCEVFIEIGPHPVLTTLGKTILEDSKVHWLASLKRDHDDWLVLLKSVAELYSLGFNIDWARFDQNQSDKRIVLPTYAWDKESYWHQAASLSPQIASLSNKDLWSNVTTAAQNQAKQAPLDLELSQHVKDETSIAQICYCYIAAAIENLTKLGSNDSHPLVLPMHQHLVDDWKAKLSDSNIIDKVKRSNSLDGDVKDLAYQLLTKQQLERPQIKPILDLIAIMGKELANILVGKISAQEILFAPQTLPNVRQLYHQPGVRYFIEIIKEILATYQKTGKKLCILEIGDRIAENTASLLSSLNPNKIEYCYSDNNELMLNQVKGALAHYPNVKFQLLNIAQDPMEQGFEPHQFDIILATYVIHSARDTHQVLKNIDSLLAPEGLLIALENTKPSTWVNMSFGLLADWKRHINDVTTSSALSLEQWLGALTKTFSKVASYPDLDSPANVLGQHVLVAQTNWTAEDKSSVNKVLTPVSTKVSSTILRFDFDKFFTSNEQEQLEAVISTLSLLTARVMRLPVSKLNKTVSIKDFGFESLMIVELRNDIKRSLAVTLALDIVATATIEDLANLVKSSITTPGFVKPGYSEQEAEIASTVEENTSTEAAKTIFQSKTSNWVICRKPNPNAKIKLFCFHHAGGNAVAFHHWADSISDEIEINAIQMPGRGERINETPIKRISVAAQEITTALQPYLDRPFAFFGHSMGGLIAFEVMRQLRKQQAALPTQLFIASRRAPQNFDTNLPVHMLPDEQFIAELKQFNGLDEAIAQEKELLKLLLPTLRADFTIIDTYVYASESPFNVPITVFGGQDDKSLTQTELKDWQEQTALSFESHFFPGDHFFLREHYTKLCQIISNKLLS